MLSAEQIEKRRRGLGASEIPAVVGLNPWKNALDIWLEKTGRAEPFAGNGRTRRGSLLEPHIIAWWAEQRGVTDLTDLGTVTVTHPDHEWLMATPDAFGRLDSQPILGEGKSPSWRVRHHWPEGEIPDYVRIQVNIQQAVTGIHRADVAAWIDDQDDRIVPVEWSQEIADSLIEIASEFWTENVIKDKPPAIDASQSWARYLSDKFPRDTAPIAEAPEDADRWFGQRKEAKAEIADATTRLDEAENALKALIGESAGIERQGLWRLTWKADSCGRVSWERVAREAGATEAQIEKHRGKPARRFLAKEF